MADVFVSATGAASYPGTKAIPTSLTNALNAVNPGDVVYFAPGVYRVITTMTRSGTASQRIRLVGDCLNTQQISGATGNVIRITSYPSDTTNPTDTLSAVLRLNGCSYIDIVGLYIEGRQASNNYCYRITSGSSITHEKCVFNNQGGSIGLYIDGTTSNITFDKCVVPYLGVRVDAGTDITFIRSIANINHGGSTGTLNAYNCTLFGYSSANTNTATPSYVYNNLVGAIQSSTTANTVIEDYNVTFSRTNVSPLGANTRTAGTLAQDWYYSSLNGIGNIPAYAALSGTPMIGNGTTAQGVSSDMFGRNWISGRTIGGIETLSLDNVSPYYPYDSQFETFTVAGGTTGYSVYLQLGSFGMTHTTTGLSVSYVKNRGVSTPISLVAQTPTGAWVSGGFCAVNNTTNPGLYRLDVPNIVLESEYDKSFILARGVSQTLGSTVILQETPSLGYQIKMGPFTVQADGILTDDRLKLIQGSVHSIDFKMVDAYGTGVDGTGTVVTAKVYNAAGFLIDTYTCTAMYALDGRYSFAIDSTVTDNVGMYTINIYRQIGTETNVFGRMKLEVLSP